MQAVGACVRERVMNGYGVVKKRRPFGPERASRIFVEEARQGSALVTLARLGSLARCTRLRLTVCLR